MLTRLLLAALCITDIVPARAKEKGGYVPIVGYTWLSKKKASAHGGVQIGIIGYSFSEDFHIEMTSNCYREARKTQATPETITVNHHPLQSKITTPHNSAFCPNTTGEDEVLYNAWQRPSNSTLLQEKEALHTTPPPLEEEPTETTLLPWIEIMLSAKYVLLRPNSCFRSYGSLSLAGICTPFLKEFSPKACCILGVGLQGRFHSNFSFDVHYAMPLKTWRDTPSQSSVLHHSSKLRIWNIGLRCHF